MDAAYVFRVAFRIEPRAAAIDPDRFETTMEIPARAPGDDGWLFFRDRLWRGEVGDESSFRRVAADRLGVAGSEGIEVVSVGFRELRVGEAYREALRAEIGADLGRFNADDVDEVVHKYLGSSIHVRAP